MKLFLYWNLSPILFSSGSPLSVFFVLLENDSATESEVDSRGSQSRGNSIGESIFIAQHPKIVGGKNVEKRYFFTDACPPLFIVVSKVTQVLGCLRIVEMVLISGRDNSGGSI